MNFDDELTAEEMLSCEFAFLGVILAVQTIIMPSKA
jgi:hypothetical protein